MIRPLDQEELIGEAGFFVGDGVEYVPIHLGELVERPIVEAAEVLSLGLMIGVGQCRSTDVAELRRNTPGDGPLV